MKISAIIPCRNERRHIEEVLRSLLGQTLDTGWELEILIADGMSDDGTREVIAPYLGGSPSVRLIDNPGQIVSTGLNAAIGAANGDIIIRIDGHTRYANNYIRECVTALEETGADNVGGPWIAEASGHIGKAIATAFHSRFCAGGGKAHQPAYEGEIDTVYLGCWRRSIFERIGLFDPELARNQDDEFNFRLRRAGGRIWQSPRIKSYYTPRSSLTTLFRQYLQYGFWRIVVIRKHRVPAAWRQVIPFSFVASILFGVAFGAIAMAAHAAGLALWIGSALGAELSVYFLACLCAALACARSTDVLTLLLVPVVICIYHVAYGLGFLVGLLRLKRSGGISTRTSTLFTQLTRSE